jgi:hypothetical protein
MNPDYFKGVKVITKKNNKKTFLVKITIQYRQATFIATENE